MTREPEDVLEMQIQQVVKKSKKKKNFVIKKSCFGNRTYESGSRQFYETDEYWNKCFTADWKQCLSKKVFTRFLSSVCTEPSQLLSQLSNGVLGGFPLRLKLLFQLQYSGVVLCHLRQVDTCRAAREKQRNA